MILTMPISSPFPGMDPYLENHWGDVHHRLIQYGSDVLQEQLPDSLRARVEERVCVETDSALTRLIAPDVRIVERERRNGGAPFQPADAPGGVAVAEPLIMIVPQEPLTEGFIEIRDRSNGNRVVTVIEVLSVANKAGGKGTRKYREKQDEILNGRANLVEIDLLREGRRVTAVSWKTVPESHRTPYHICVKRASPPGHYEIYRVPLRERLPIIRIPLRHTDADVTLDLQSLLEQTYRTGRYDDIDYKEEAEPPLEGDDAKWADNLLRQGGRR